MKIKSAAKLFQPIPVTQVPPLGVPSVGHVTFCTQNTGRHRKYLLRQMRKTRKEGARGRAGSHENPFASDR